MNIYVGNLSYRMTEEDLRAAFEQFGEVTSAKIISDRESGRSKGFGFVEMSSDEDAESAIRDLDGSDVMGRTLKVNQARPRSDRPPGGGGQRY